MFLQYLMLPVWCSPILPYVRALPGGGDWALWCGLLMGFGTFAAPIVGMIADRFSNAERVMAICDFFCAALLSIAFFVNSPAILFCILLAAMCAYIPTWSLVATIGMTHLDANAFVRVRVFGTLGWMASGLCAVIADKTFGLRTFDSSPWIFAAGAALAAVAGLVALALPPTAPLAKGNPVSIADALGLKALALFRRPAFSFFAILLLLSMIPYQWFNVYGAAYLKSAGVDYVTLTLNAGKAAALAFMLLIPLIMSRFGFRKVMMFGFAALAIRDASFASSIRFGAHALDWLGILAHGVIYNVFVVGSQMHIDAIAPKALRNQAQGLVCLITSGIGVFASNACFDLLLRQDGATEPFAWERAFAFALFLTLATAATLTLTALPNRLRQRHRPHPPASATLR